MRTLLTPYIYSLTVLLLVFSSLPHSSDASLEPDDKMTDVTVRQDISISFDLDKAVMRGESTITLLPGRQLRLLFGDLEQVRIMVRKGGADDAADTVYDTAYNADNDNAAYDARREIAPNEDNTLFLAPVSLERTFSVSWQVTAAPPGHASGNLISPRGITLTGFWHPVAEQDMLFSLTAELPIGFNGVTEADEIDIKIDISADDISADDSTEADGIYNDKQLLTASYPHPLRSINFAAGPYTVLSRQIGGDLRDLKVYTYFFKEDARLAPDYLDKAVEYIKRYERLIGPFPFKRYSIVENRLPTGYGMPGFTLLGQAVVRLPFIKDTSLGHEILHSWFGNAVRNDDTGNWCEGLTTLLADQSYAAEKGEGVQYRRNQLLRYQSYVEKGSLTSVIDFQHGGDSQPMARKMRAVGYDKAGMLFHTLRREIGDEHFFAALRRFYEEKKYKEAGWKDLERIFEETSGDSLTQFFGQWLLRNDIPSLSAEQVTIEQDGGDSVVSFHLVQSTETPYRLQLPIMVKTRQGTKKEIVDIETADQEVSITVDSMPTELIIDPEYNFMRKLDNAERPPVWMRFMGAEQKTAVLPENREDLYRYLPLTAELERWGCRLVRAEELKNSELTQGSFLFLGSSSHSRGLFGPAKYGFAEDGAAGGAAVENTTVGFTLDVHKNPLNQEEVMVLLSSASAEESERALPKLRHYGKYSRLRFNNGRIKEKHIAPAVNGIRLPLLRPSAGIPVQQVKGFSAIIADIAQSRIIYAGEIHTDYGSHLLQLQIIQALRERLELEQAGGSNNDGLAIGMEMFPRTSQHALDGYISGAISTEREFLRRSGYYDVWGYDYRMYRDIINYARAHRIPIVGLNLSRKVVSSVFNKGTTDELTPEQLAEAAAERDLELPGYRGRLEKVHAMHGESEKNGGFSGFIQAQSIWDETMAESIVNYLLAHPEKKMVVLAGTGHLYKDSAVPPRVARRMDGRQSVLIANDGRQTGSEQGSQADYLMFTENVQLPPAGKIGIMLKEEEKTAEQPARVKITGIIPHGKAGEAGLEKGDVIMAVDSSPVTTVGDLKMVLIDKKPGETVLLNIVRKDKILRIKAELSDMEKAAAMPSGHPKK
jgi:uncharacterized iron-regulated protein